jgi:hypothetical protein
MNFVYYSTRVAAMLQGLLIVVHTMISITIQSITMIIRVLTGPQKHIMVKSVEYDLESIRGIVIEK